MVKKQGKFSGISTLLSDDPEIKKNSATESNTLELVTVPVRTNAVEEKRITTSYSINAGLVKRVKLVSAEYDMKNWQVVEAALKMYFKSLEEKSK
jgi:hypothetical protein